MIELASNFCAIIYSIESKFRICSLKFEERFERLEFNFDKNQRNHFKEGLKENIYRYFNNSQVNLNIVKTSILDLKDQVSNLSENTDSLANFKLQIFMLILTIIFTLWGGFTLIYDKAISITSKIKSMMDSIQILGPVMLSFFNNNYFSLFGSKG